MNEQEFTFTVAGPGRQVVMLDLSTIDAQPGHSFEVDLEYVDNGTEENPSAPHTMCPMLPVSLSLSAAMVNGAVVILATEEGTVQRCWLKVHAEGSSLRIAIKRAGGPLDGVLTVRLAPDTEVTDFGRIEAAKAPTVRETPRPRAEWPDRWIFSNRPSGD